VAIRSTSRCVRVIFVEPNWRCWRCCSITPFD
jgi:hypothetical protein